MTEVARAPRDRRRIVADGYDAVADRYLAWSPGRPSATRTAWLARALAQIPPGSFFSHFGARANRALVRRVGFEIVEAVVEAEPDDRHGARFLWIVARKPVP